MKKVREFPKISLDDRIDIIIMGVSLTKEPDTPEYRANPTLSGIHTIRTVRVISGTREDVDFVFDRNKGRIIGSSETGLGRMTTKSDMEALAPYFNSYLSDVGAQD